MYVKAGTRLFTIADLRRVWVLLDVYESDLHLVRKGQKVRFEAESYPGEPFEGKVAFIDPYVTDRTRTIKVRVEVKNPKGRLKPDMLVRAVLKSDVAGALAAGAGKAPLVIPVTAPLITGPRAIVYVQKKPGTYEGQEIVLGPRVGRHYVVRKGLNEGDKVVSRGAFRIDAALQILARPSMMNPPPKVPPKFRKQLDAVYAAYFGMHHGLSRDKVAPARTGALKLRKALARVDAKLLRGVTKEDWEKVEPDLKEHTSKVAKASDIKRARVHFEGVSNAMIKIARRFGGAGGKPVIRYYCPMAFNNKGAYWLQPNKGVENPYFGSEMYQCGEQLETLVQRAKGE